MKWDEKQEYNASAKVQRGERSDESKQLNSEVAAPVQPRMQRSPKTEAGLTSSFLCMASQVPLERTPCGLGGSWAPPVLLDVGPLLWLLSCARLRAESDWFTALS